MTLQASFVTPFIVHYERRYPAVRALELLPLYDGIARMKSHAHWQTDVLGGWMLANSPRHLPVSDFTRAYARTWRIP
ncbi:hypothetical protein [Paraburkholderia sp. BL6669N2]|uniref:hypothetical protein n=1 Tax=Paraburkholderia sp. BL6669N2 TaxID=1938807 RepID=UPI0028684C50|nr:hypothetical protein [Paraburkholderia sp. BL6669N2]